MPRPGTVPTATAEGTANGVTMRRDPIPSDIMNRIIRLLKTPWLRIVLAGTLLYLLAGFLLVPLLIRQAVPPLAEERLQRRLSLGEMRFNPILLTLEARDIRLTELDDQPIIGLKRLFVDFELARSLAARAWTLAELQLDGPQVNLVQDKEGRFNVTRIGDSLPPDPEPADSPLPRLFLQHIVLADGEFRFTDNSTQPPTVLSPDQFGLELTNISTLPERAGVYTIKAALPEGGSLAWQGDVALNPIRSSGTLSVEKLSLGTLWALTKDRLNLAEPHGEISLSAHYKLAREQDTTTLALSEGHFRLAGLNLTLLHDTAPLLTLDELGFSDASLDLGHQQVTLPKIAINKGKLRISLNKDGQLNWQGLMKPSAAEPTQAAAQPATAAARLPWKLSVADFTLANIAVDYADNSRKIPLQAALGELGLSLKAEAEAGAGAPRLRVADLTVNLNRLGLSRADETLPWFGWDHFGAEGGEMDLEQRTASFRRVAIEGGGTQFSRDANGTLRPLDLFTAENDNAPPVSAPTAGPAVDPAGHTPDWRFALNQFSLQGFGVALKDRSLTPHPAYTLDNLTLSASHISNDGKTPLAFDARVNIREGGSIALSGSAANRGDSATAKLQLNRLDLTPLQAMIGQFADLTLAEATLSSDLALSFRKASPNPAIRVTGAANLDNLRLIQSKDQQRFLTWKDLALKGINLSLAPDALTIKEVRVSQPDTAIAIFEDKTTNIGAVFKSQPAPPPTRPGSPQTARPKPATAKVSATATAKAQPFPLSIGRILIDQGRVVFSDASLILPFATRVDDFGGSVAGFSLQPDSRAIMAFKGRVDQYGEAAVEGSLSPLALKNYSDIRVTFGNVAMTSLSPYSATFAGRKIQSGTLNLDLEYKIDQHKLNSSNRIVLEKFALGDSVESPKATSLPLDLAIALLTDSNGRIEAFVPMEGDVDAPSFSYGGVIWDAIVNMITNAATAPFHALASLLGSGEGDPGAVLFDPGNASIPPPEREKLRKLAEGLASRSRLKLTVFGQFDPKSDATALKSRVIRRAVADQLGVSLAPEDDPDAVSFTDPATQRALEKLAAEQGGADEVEARYTEQTGQPPQRIGALTGLMGRASLTPEFYQQLYDHLIDHAALAADALTGLADRRGQAVMTELLARDRFDRRRLTLGGSAALKDAATGRVPTRLELAAE